MEPTPTEKGGADFLAKLAMLGKKGGATAAREESGANGNGDEKQQGGGHALPSKPHRIGKERHQKDSASALCKLHRWCKDRKLLYPSYKFSEDIAAGTFHAVCTVDNRSFTSKACHSRKRAKLNAAYTAFAFLSKSQRPPDNNTPQTTHVNSPNNTKAEPPVLQSPPPASQPPSPLPAPTVSNPPVDLQRSPSALPSSLPTTPCSNPVDLQRPPPALSDSRPNAPYAGADFFPTPTPAPPNTPPCPGDPFNRHTEEGQLSRPLFVRSLPAYQTFTPGTSQQYTPVDYQFFPPPYNLAGMPTNGSFPMHAYRHPPMPPPSVYLPQSWPPQFRQEHFTMAPHQPLRPGPSGGFVQPLPGGAKQEVPTQDVVVGPPTGGYVEILPGAAAPSQDLVLVAASPGKRARNDDEVLAADHADPTAKRLMLERGASSKGLATGGKPEDFRTSEHEDPSLMAYKKLIHQYGLVEKDEALNDEATTGGKPNDSALGMFGGLWPMGLLQPPPPPQAVDPVVEGDVADDGEDGSSAEASESEDASGDVKMEELSGGLDPPDVPREEVSCPEVPPSGDPVATVAGQSTAAGQSSADTVPTVHEAQHNAAVEELVRHGVGVTEIEIVECDGTIPEENVWRMRVVLGSTSFDGIVLGTSTFDCVGSTRLAAAGAAAKLAAQYLKETAKERTVRPFFDKFFPDPQPAG